MNTPKSVFYGWGVFTAAGALAYIIASKEIDERRRKFTQSQQKLSWEEKVELSLKNQNNQQTTTSNDSSGGGGTGSSS